MVTSAVGNAWGYSRMPEIHENWLDSCLCITEVASLVMELLYVSRSEARQRPGLGQGDAIFTDWNARDASSRSLDGF